MDPLTALSLGCNVIQVIDVSAKIVTRCKELYKDGASAKNKDIGSMAKYLANVSTDLKLPETSPSAGSAQQGCQEDEKILKLAQQCSETANDLICELQKLAIQGPHRKRDAVLKAVKQTWNKTIIESFENRLDQHRKTLDTLILIDLRQHARKVSTEQSKAFKDLDRKVQTFINAVAGDQEPFAALKESIQNENASYKQQFIEEVEKLHVQIACQDSYKSLLESLYFPDIHARQEGIEEAHKNTFEWIFEKPRDHLQPWHDFVHWLESGHGIYWISGKAGSGKSTLMNLICRDLRINAALKIWSGTSEVFSPKFFFWNAGTELQKSSRGLLRSIIYQIMEKAPELLPILERSIYTTQQRTQQLPTWTERRLLATLQHLLRHGLRSYRLCIFIDGLDEFSSNQDELLELIRDLRQYSNIKICLSSRPYRFFQDEFGSSAMLKLQDLTEPDIRKYTSDKLKRAHRKTSQALHSSFRLDEIASMIVQRAEGVFLWVKLAVRDQLEGIRNHDDANQLLERLYILPDEIEGIYLHMLQRIDKVYWKEVACYFHFVLEFGDSSLFYLALAVHDRIDDILLFSPGISLREIRRHCRSIRERIATTCQGILEVRETDRHQSQELASFKSLVDQLRTPKRRNDLMGLKYYQECSRVVFLHRTAFDFFKDNVQAKQFLDASAFVSPHLDVLYTKDMLAQLAVFQFLEDDGSVQHLIDRIMTYVSLIETKTGAAQPALMDLIDRSLSILSQRSRGHPSNVHWCRAWDYPETYAKYRDDSILKIVPTNLPGFAASLAASGGLGLYVVSTIDSQSERRTCSTADYLLGCALYGSGWNQFSLPDNNPQVQPCRYLELIIALLERGANPQMKYPEGTAWGFFLQLLYVECFHRPTLFMGLETTWDSTLRAFLASGANTNEMARCFYGELRLKESTHEVLLNGPRVTEYKFCLHVSPRMILRLCFDRDPVFYRLDEAFIVSGGSVCSERTSVSVVIRDKGGRHRCLDLKLSQQQGDDFIEALKWRPHTRFSVSPRIEHQIEKLFQELDLPQLYNKAAQEEALQEHIIQEEESGDDEKNTDSEYVLDEWRTESSDSSDAEIEEPAQSSQSP